LERQWRFVRRVIREVSRLRDEPASRAESILQAGLKDAIVTHLRPYANITVDTTDPENPFGSLVARWLSDRNRVVHDGYAPNESEAARALRQGVAIARAVQEGLRSREVTKPLGDVLLTEFTVPEGEESQA
jgi:hypothetical protein